MGIRAALNTVYAMLVKDLDRNQRHEFDTELYGWGAENTRGTRFLLDPRDADTGDGA